MSEKPLGAGKSSFDLIDAEALFAELPLAPDTSFLDIACGAGAYSLAVAERIGSAGKIYAFDLWAEGIEILKKEVAARNLGQIQAAVADLGKAIPLGNGSVDVCLVATVLHDFIALGSEQGALSEIRRVVKPGGILAVVEFKVMDGPPGPPKAVRITPEAARGVVAEHGFSFLKNKELGPYNYLSLFGRQP